MAYTNGIKSFWAMCKCEYIGAYHQCRVKHMQRDMNECSGRHNGQKFDTIEQMSIMANFAYGNGYGIGI